MHTTGVGNTATHDRRVRRPSLIVGGLLLVAVVGISACGASSSSASSGAGSEAQRAAAPASHKATSAQGSTASTGSNGGAGGTAGSAGSSSSGKLGTTVAASSPDIVRTGSVDLVAANSADLRRAYAGVATLATDDGGFVASSALTTGKRPTAQVGVRVVEGQFASAMAAITSGQYGKADNTRQSGQDVTGQVVDLKVEITNLTSEAQAVRQLLARAGSVRNILTIQQQLFSLQGEIQELQAQSNSLGNQVEYATITVHLATVAPAPVTPAVHHTSTLARFWHLASSHSVAAVRNIVLAVGWAAPLLVALAVVAGGWLLWRRRRHQGPVAG
jgi:Domain of unknown function (DUF4349)